MALDVVFNKIRLCNSNFKTTICLLFAPSRSSADSYILLCTQAAPWPPCCSQGYPFILLTEERVRINLWWMLYYWLYL